MAKFYATGTKKTKRKNEETGLVETVLVTKVIGLDSTIRLFAIQEAEEKARMNGITLDENPVHLIKGSNDIGRVMTKDILKKKRAGTLPAF